MWPGFLQRFLRRNVPAHLRSGEWGEDRAAAFLQARGYRVLGRRIRFGSHDELDIVARCGETLVFAEVKTRADETFGRAALAVDRDKRRTRQCREQLGHETLLVDPPTSYSNY